MIGWLARAVLANPLLTVLGVLALAVFGVRSYLALPIDAVPDLTSTQVQVLTSARGLSPMEVERMVTRPVELSLTGIPGVARVRSLSRAGVSAVTVVFVDGADIHHARQLVAQQLPRAREAIPASAGRPELGPLTTGLGEVYHFTVRWPGHSLREVRTLLDYSIAYRLRSVPGVVEVNSWGGETRELEVRLRDSDLLANRVTPSMIERAVGDFGKTVSGGLLETAEEGTFVRADAVYRSPEHVAHQVVATRNGPNGTGETGRPLLVQDVATVADGTALRFAAATADGKGESIYTMVQMIPALGAIVLKRPKNHEPRLARLLRRAYSPIVDALLLRWKTVAAGMAALIAAGTAIGATRGAEFVPRLEEGDLAIQITRPPSVSLAEANQGTTVVERTLLELPEVKRVVSRTGSPDVATDVMGIEQSDVMVILKPRSDWVAASDAAGFAEVLEPKLRAVLPGAAFGFTQPIEMRVQELIGGVKADVGIKVYGDDLTTLRRLSEKVARIAAATPGAADVRTEPMSGLRTLTIQPDPRQMGRLGVHHDDLLPWIEAVRLGRPVGILAEGERRFDIVLRMDDPPAPDHEPFARLRIPLDGGRTVTLGQVAQVSVGDGPAQISREQGQRRVLVETNVRGRDLAGFVQDLHERMAALPLPAGCHLEYGGEYENLARAAARLSLLVPATLATILGLLYLAFGALRPAVLIFVNVPAAATGGLFALALRGLDFSVSAAVGFLALFGVATLNGVVLLAAVRNRQASGEDSASAVRTAAAERLRPVLTTALVAALGFVPMALATGTGAEVQRPLATVVIGGLVTATLATLLALPALYLRFGGRPSEPA